MAQTALHHLQLLFDPVDVAFNAEAHPSFLRLLQAVLFHGQPLDPLPPPRQLIGQRLGRGIGQDAHRGLNSGGKMRQHPGIQAVGFGQVAQGLGKPPDLARIDHGYRQLGDQQLGHPRPL